MLDRVKNTQQLLRGHLFVSHVTGLAKANEIRQIVSLCLCSKLPEWANVMD